ncbi:hypothetical protein MyNCGM152_12760 [Achromobacter xylosoxidans]
MPLFLASDQISDAWSQQILFDGVEQRRQARGRHFAENKLIEIAIQYREMPPPYAQGSKNSPTCAIQHDFHANPSVRKRRTNSVALIFGSKLILAQAIAQQPAEQGLASAMADAIVVRRPHDIQAWT